MRVLHLVSCRGWSSDAYWAARMVRELDRQGHEATLACRADAGTRVIERARAEGVRRIETLAFASGLQPAADVRDIRRLAARLSEADLVHVHRGKEHWLAALANHVAAKPRPIVRTRHIVQVVRPHAANRWLYRSATARVVAVTDMIRRQYVASGLLSADRVVVLSGGADADAYHPGIDPTPARRALGAPDGEPLVGLVGGLRAMKGHRTVVDAVGRLARAGRRPRVAFIGRGAMEPAIRQAVAEAGLDDRFVFGGFRSDLPATMAAFDIALYVPVESEGMSRVVFEYLAAGRPMIASRVGVVAEVLRHGQDALLIPAGDPEALAQAMGQLLDDGGLRTRLGGEARRRVEAEFSGQRVAARLAELYASLA
jgi:glycosyltransferase involved in cell wall biosynthesis